MRDGTNGGDAAAKEGPRSLTQIKPGTLIEGKYLVERVLGRGGMGVVLAATEVGSSKRVALKFLEVQSDEGLDSFHSRFALEARVCAKLKNVHIARVHDTGVWQGVFPFMVMDYLEGIDLRKLRKGSQRLPLAQAVDYVVQICDGVAEAHAQGIVHRDLKPANIFITKQDDGSDRVKVLDFGISKWAQGGDEFSELTKAGTMLGSPKYMSPEQLHGSAIDARADIWSIGAILYTMLTGKPPYDFAQVTQTFIAIASGVPPLAPSTVDPSITPAVDAVVLKALTKNRDERFANVAEFAAALLQAIDSPVAQQVKEHLTVGLDPTASSTSMWPEVSAIMKVSHPASFSLANLAAQANAAKAAAAPPANDVAGARDEQTGAKKKPLVVASPLTSPTSTNGESLRRIVRAVRPWWGLAAAAVVLAVAAFTSASTQNPPSASAIVKPRTREVAAKHLTNTGTTALAATPRPDGQDAQEAVSNAASDEP